MTRLVEAAARKMVSQGGGQAHFVRGTFQAAPAKRTCPLLCLTSTRPLEHWGKLIGDVPAATAASASNVALLDGDNRTRLIVDGVCKVEACCSMAAAGLSRRFRGTPPEAAPA